MNFQSKFGYCIITQTLNLALLFVFELRTDGQTNGRADRRTIQITRCPRRTFQAGGIKIQPKIGISTTVIPLGSTNVSSARSVSTSIKSMQEQGNRENKQLYK